MGFETVERKGESLLSGNFKAPAMFGIALGVGLVVVGGIALSIWNMGGSFVSGTFGNLVRGLWRLGTETVEQGTDFDLNRVGGA